MAKNDFQEFSSFSRSLFFCQSAYLTTIISMTPTTRSRCAASPLSTADRYTMKKGISNQLRLLFFYLIACEAYSTSPIRSVVVVGGTHGNEYTGVCKYVQRTRAVNDFRRLANNTLGTFAFAIQGALNTCKPILPSDNNTRHCILILYSAIRWRTCKIGVSLTMT